MTNKLKNGLAILGGLAALGLLAAITIPSFVGKGPMHDHLCYNNLRRIDGAKEQLALNNALTNGTAVTAEQISPSPYFKNGFTSLQCGEKGKYTINPIGEEPRCSFHGTMTEMDANRRVEVSPTNKSTLSPGSPAQRDL